ncbi:organic hydroperoxide resistance protein [Pontibacillus sp. ALD_SL1]|uniref:organic hydroperoxide resistance protein n=1 Tax=Pontibacillus sp. ALD_SL1 TaxID=2777185 RepID=UPI001AFB33DB|nr:organic hydroperoxide resistance protein [Pontibacillus sp. ALD_SL1]QSS99851.1 organic hydroperoxide resistance protein [Pontibacillus sp. ALD_SL1]
MKVLYTAEATAKGGREGSVSTSDNKVEHNLSTPEGLGGPGGEGTNPEQLFACGYSACFDGALNLVADQSGENIESTVTAKVDIGKGNDGLGLGVQIHVEISGVDQSKAEELVNKAHDVCPYSRATRGNIEVSLETKAV